MSDPSVCSLGPTDLESLAVEHGPDALLVVDPELRVVWANGAAEHLLGHLREEALGRDIWEFVHPDDAEQALGAVSESFRREGYHAATRIRVRRAGGGWVDARITGTTLEIDGRTWMVLSVRAADTEVAIERRRTNLKALAQSIYVNCAAMHWYAESEQVHTMLGQVASMVAADSVVLAEPLPGDTTGGADAARRFRVVGEWSGSDEHHHPVGSTVDLEAPFATVRDHPCAMSYPEGVGGPEVIELLLERDDVDGLARLHFAEHSEEWDDANADIVGIMASTLLATIDRCRTERRVHDEARLDPLTRLLNRGALEERLSDMLSESEVGAAPVVLFADLNRFKELNDTQGHAAGDTALRAVADAISGAIRDGDAAARIGGDEFVVVFAAPEESSGQLVARIRTAVDQALLPWPGVSVAVGAIVVGAADSPLDVLTRADHAMYRDKWDRRPGGGDPSDHRPAAEVPDGADPSLRRRADDPVRRRRTPVARPALPADDTDEGARQQRLFAALASAVDVVLVVDAAAHVVVASPSVEQVFGFTPEEAVGLDVMDLVHVEDQPRAVSEFLQSVDKPGEKEPLALRVRDANGRWRPVEVAAVNCLDDPAVAGLVVTVRDRTGEAEVERTLRRRDDAYRQIVELAAEGVWMTDSSGVFSFVTTRLCALLGRSSEEMLGRRAMEFVASRDRELAERQQRRCREGITEEYEVHLRHADGHDVPVRMVTTPVLGHKDAFLGAIGLVSDLTTLRAAGLLPSGVDAGWRRLLGTFADVVMRCSASGVVLECDAVLPEVFGGDASALRGQRIDEIFTDGDGVLMSALRTAVVTGSTMSVRVELDAALSRTTFEFHLTPAEGSVLVVARLVPQDGLVPMVGRIGPGGR